MACRFDNDDERKWSAGWGTAACNFVIFDVRIGAAHVMIGGDISGLRWLPGNRRRAVDSFFR